ncbi:FK506-binding protein 5-like protein [Cinnamomum micranthum f. kanehirae]|uniref:FK506-binding protein 5-like protein n=1 Tax=Cinnamomum micranthum f. kanehirae TaxID=337451 RepID=A0A443NAZ5_9MAGN|nr:FK506-binding protein 5-like protein [Cinnamomum micranthum f. kanehirae]
MGRSKGENDTDSLRPNSVQPIPIYGHNICIRFHNERGSEHWVWECHGHSVILDLILNYTITGESRMGYVADQEARVERAVIHAIVTGDTAWLRPNSGRPVMIGGHNINVQCHGDRGDDYRVWEWHGHVMTYDEENGYSLDYIFWTLL